MGNKPDDDDLLHGEFSTERRVDYSSKPVRNVGMVSCAECLGIDGDHARYCKKNN